MPETENSDPTHIKCVLYHHTMLTHLLVNLLAISFSPRKGSSLDGRYILSPACNQRKQVREGDCRMGLFNSTQAYGYSVTFCVIRNTSLPPKPTHHPAPGLPSTCPLQTPSKAPSPAAFPGAPAGAFFPFFLGAQTPCTLPGPPGHTLREDSVSSSQLEHCPLQRPVPRPQLRSPSTTLPRGTVCPESPSLPTPQRAAAGDQAPPRPRPSLSRSPSEAAAWRDASRDPGPRRQEMSGKLRSHDPRPPRRPGARPSQPAWLPDRRAQTDGRRRAGSSPLPIAAAPRPDPSRPLTKIRGGTRPRSPPPQSSDASFARRRRALLTPLPTAPDRLLKSGQAATLPLAAIEPRVSRHRPGPQNAIG
ncbi:vegetative cell wall protein gp1-like [Trichosurus vulpecula]|uniref:vegetative cell wall protein gp1-like n=1 Tax=Trichosurus vulpecula TaxID=9337 RepID=UPI00186B53E1|nr:vegetative cell wall protein gp1-like [Trichosurus vulpecula]